MQSSLLALALATKFFQDPLVGIPPAISVSSKTEMAFRHCRNLLFLNIIEVIVFCVCVCLQTVVMSLMGFTLVMIWSNEKEQRI